MVVMVVADQNSMDGREIREFHSRRPVPFGASKAYGAAALGPNGVGQKIEPVCLDEYRGVVDVREPDIIYRVLRGWFVCLGVFNPIWPRCFFSLFDDFNKITEFFCPTLPGL